MDAFKKTMNDYWQLLSQMTRSQKATMAVVSGFVVGLLLYLAFRGPGGSYVPLLQGAAMTSDAISEVEQALIDEGLTDFKRKGQQLLVPSGQQARYAAALMQVNALPMGWGVAIGEQLEKSGGVFESTRMMNERSRVALSNTLQGIIQKIPGVQRASVVWDSNSTGRWPHEKTKPTAGVNIVMKNGRPVPPKLVNSLQEAVGSMVPNVTPDDVTIFDINAQATHKRSPVDKLESELQRRIKKFHQEFEEKIANALTYIPGVIVSVHIDVENIKSQSEQTRQLDKTNAISISQETSTTDDSFQEQPLAGEPGVATNQPRNLAARNAPLRNNKSRSEDTRTLTYPGMTVSRKEYFAAMPKDVQVAITIPRDYYEAVAKRRGIPAGETDEEQAAFKAAVDEIEKVELEKAREVATRLIPAGSPANAVVVNSYTPVVAPVDEIAPSVVDRASDFFGNYGSSLALAAFAAFAIWTLRKQLPELPNLQEQQQAETDSPNSDEEPEPEPPAPETLQKEALQNLVRDNPEATANIIEGWLEEAKAGS